MRNRLFSLTASAAALALLCASHPAHAADTAIASIGTQPVTASDLKDMLDSLTPQQKSEAAQNPQLSAQFVRDAIARKLLLEAAAKAGWDKKPEVEAQIARARDQIVINTYMASQTQPPADFPSADDVQKAYDENHEHIFQYHLAQIFIGQKPGMTKDQVADLAKKAEALAAKAKARGADFAALARANSEDVQSASKGGDLGWVPQTQISPEILGAVMALGGKGVSDPVEVGGGWHIMSVTGVKAAELDQVKDQIVALLRQSKGQQNQQAYLGKLLSDDKVTVNEAAAAALFGQKK